MGLRVREHGRDHAGIYETRRRGGGAETRGAGRGGREGGQTCYFLKPKSRIPRAAYIYIYRRYLVRIYCIRIFRSGPALPFPLYLLASLLSLIRLCVYRCARYQTGHKLIPSNVLIRYPVLRSLPRPPFVLGTAKQG